MSKILQVIGVVILLIPFLITIIVRFAPINAENFHIDPLTDGQKGNEGGFYLAPENGDMVAPIYNMSTTQLAQKIDAMFKVSGIPIAGDIHDNFATYIFRSQAFGFPDYLSIRLIEIDGTHTTMAIYSRLRFGKKDFGVNRKRVERILELLNDPTSLK